MKCKIICCGNDRDPEIETDISKNSEWKGLLFYLKFFGIFVADNELEDKSTTTIKPKLRIGLFIFWILMPICFIIVRVIALLQQNAAFSALYTVSLLFAIIVGIMLRHTIDKFSRAFTKVLQMRETVDSKNRYDKENRLAFILFFIILAPYGLNIIRTVIPGKEHSKYVSAMTYGVFYNVSPSNLLESFVVVYVDLHAILFYTYMHFIPWFSASIFYLAQTENYRLLHSYISSINAITIYNVTPTQLTCMSASYSKVTSTIKEVNDTFSALVFVLLGYWFTYVCYAIGIILKVDECILKRIVNVFAVGIFAGEFFSLIRVTVKVDKEILKAKNSFMMTAETDNSLFSNASKASNILLMESYFKHFRRDVSVKPMGIFSLDRKLILLVVGLITVYEIVTHQVKN